MTRHWLHEGSGPFRPADALPLTDRGFRYGMAVFETLRVSDGVVEFLGEHLWRLARACRDSEFPVARATLRVAGRVLRDEVAALPPAWTGVARLHVTAGDGGPADPPRACRVLVSMERRDPPPDALYRDGLRLHVHSTPHHPAFGGRKTHNYWNHVAALQAARHAGADEALLSDAEGRLISACMGNVFLLRNGQLATPPTFLGVRNGVWRARLLRWTNATVREISAHEWQTPDAVFLVTNSWLGGVPGFLRNHEPSDAARRAACELVQTVTPGGRPPRP